MNCEEVMELMQRSLDGDLDKAETSRMKEHIQTCPDCAAMFERLTLLSDNLAQLPRVVPSFSIVDSILPQLEMIELAANAPQEAIRLEQPAQRTSRSARKSVYRRLAGAIAAGVAAGLLIVSWPSLRPPQSDQNNSFNAASVSSSGSNAASSSPSASVTDQTARQFSVSGEDQYGDLEGASPKMEAGQPAASSEPSFFSEPNEPEPGISEPDSTPLQESADTRGFAEEPNEGNAPMTSFGAVDSGGTPAPEDEPGVEPSEEPAATLQVPMSSGFAIAPPVVWASPDGKYEAVIEENRLKVYQLADGSLLFESEEHPDSTIGDIVWDDDTGVLHYTRTDASGEAVRLEWTAASSQEQPEADSPESEDRP
ncbi:zf-HC2 domain-containing protein [Cohnella lubricantis]|uniref:Anti-sigma-W factor RsiW n=1 Tax=Cohnella lubricantis TaxID=2163172 RepID=A0A841TBG8_9BACL|nr:zf-HC2 domain-containing protein [Cohnella lubricantis]MBB6675771.1 zf-HC2 domain-containing protein [Cohnella lubricantis]MBP2119846.1 hypothetical protein [Cohnella lubricantis]